MTLWTFQSTDGEDVQQIVCCAACSRAFTVVPGKSSAQVADDDIECQICE